MMCNNDRTTTEKLKRSWKLLPLSDFSDPFFVEEAPVCTVASESSKFHKDIISYTTITSYCYGSNLIQLHQGTNPLKIRQLDSFFSTTFNIRLRKIAAKTLSQDFKMNKSEMRIIFQTLIFVDYINFQARSEEDIQTLHNCNLQHLLQVPTFIYLVRSIATSSELGF